mgnify:CR=1 FL=1|tara:strand:+ start:7545 stop:7949 length:405 start_codon:yes stop_codon:yes gene_type:complete
MTEESKSVEPGDVIAGEVTNVTNFGAFVKLENGEEGLVHISEIANSYVKNIEEFVQAGNQVSVTVLKRNNSNKLELSLKGKEETEEPKEIFIKNKTKDNDFEDKLTTFMKRSEEKLIDIKRNLKNKQGIMKRKK